MSSIIGATLNEVHTTIGIDEPECYFIYAHILTKTRLRMAEMILHRSLDNIS